MMSFSLLNVLLIHLNFQFLPSEQFDPNQRTVAEKFIINSFFKHALFTCAQMCRRFFGYLIQKSIFIEMTNITKSAFKMLTLSGFNSQSIRVEGSPCLGGSQNRHRGVIYGSTTVRYKTLIQIQKKYQQIALFNLKPLLSRLALEIQS